MISVLLDYNGYYSSVITFSFRRTFSRVSNFSPIEMTESEQQNARDIIEDQKVEVYYGCFHKALMINCFQLDSVPISNFIQFKFSANEYLCGGQGDGMKRKNFILGTGLRS